MGEVMDHVRHALHGPIRTKIEAAADERFAKELPGGIPPKPLEPVDRKYEPPLCPQCSASDMVFAKMVPGMKGDRIVYECDRCDREVASQDANVDTPIKEVESELSKGCEFSV